MARDREWWNQRTPKQKRRILIVAGAVFLALLFAAVSGKGRSHTTTDWDIAKMSCAELHEFYDREIKPNIDPSRSFERQRLGMDEATQLNARADALGGCPGSDNW